MVKKIEIEVELDDTKVEEWKQGALKASPFTNKDGLDEYFQKKFLDELSVAMFSNRQNTLKFITNTKTKIIV
jgi:hypothetical protein